ncbi:MAG: glycosyltransferase [Actinobacteria bacterium]|nr:glycosyltransferase [Actinomycetota bacterium]
MFGRSGPLRAAAVICAVNEERIIESAIAEARRVNGLDQVIVVVNGCTDSTARLAQKLDAEVLEYPERLGHDVGRAVGAAEADADAVLFLDGDFVVPASELEPFMEAVRRGVDMALNNLTPLYSERALEHSVNVGKRFLNLACGRPSLGLSTLTAVPHALSRRAIELLGPQVLAVPPLAQVKAILSGLVVRAVHPVDVITPNPLRPGVNTGHGEETVERMILGDHLEALGYLLERLGPRGGFTDLGRKRRATREFGRES